MHDNTLIADTAQRIFRELGDPRAYRAEQRPRLSAALDEAGLTRTWVEASLTDGFEVLRIAGEFAVCVPLAETMLAGWLLARAGIDLPAGCLSLAPVDPRDRCVLDRHDQVTGAARAVPFASEVEHLAVLAERDGKPFVALIARGNFDGAPKKNLAGEPRDTVVFRSARTVAVRSAHVAFDELWLMGAALRAMQMAGALQAILDASVRYANERIAFGKPIGKFQAIQHALAKLAGETAAAIAAAGSAADALATTDVSDRALVLEVASAKIRVGEAAAVGAAIAHQVHGAIGFSAEHVLHRYTQRLLAWRDDFGSESLWAERLGRIVAQSGANALWPMLASR